MEWNTKFTFNEEVMDKYTGYSGVITAIAKYVTGETSYLIEDRDSTGRPISEWIEERRIAD
ncbi:MAG: hypothetical protein IJH75_03755 [Mogibacterium sp.]|nr:hypothetical protein [Mogibacterium sp.]